MVLLGRHFSMRLNTTVLYRAIFSLLMILVNVNGSAQHYQIHEYTVKQGLPGQNVYSLLQDSKGYLWLTTDVGVARYDGYRFEVFTTADGLYDNTNFGISEDAKGRMWFRGFNGSISCFDKDHFLSIPANTQLQKETAGSIIVSLVVSDKDEIFIGTNFGMQLKLSALGKDEKGVKVVARENQIVVHQSPDVKGLFSYHGRNANAVFFQWSASQRNLFWKYSKVDSTQMHRVQILSFSTGTIAVSFDQYLLVQRKNARPKLLELPSRIIDFEESKSGELFVCGFFGVRKFYSDLQAAPHEFSFFDDKVVTDFIIDREGQYWIATEASGLFSIPFPEFRYLGEGKGLSGVGITKVIAKDSVVYIGTQTGEVYQVEQGKITSYKIQSRITGSVYPRVNDMLFSSSGELIIGGNSYHAVLGKNTVRIFLDKGTRGLDEDGEGNLWTVVYSTVYRIDSRLDTTRMFSSLGSIYCDLIFPLNKDTLLFASNNGVYWMDPKEQVLHDYLPQQFFFRDRIVRIQKLKNGIQLFASKGNGMLIRKDGRSMYLNDKNGLSGNLCKGFLAEGDSVLWITTNKGLDRVSFCEGSVCKYRVTHYTQRNGLDSDDISDVLRVGKHLWLIHSNSITVVDPQMFFRNNNRPPVYIREIFTQQSGELSEDNKQLSYDNNSIRFSYTGIALLMPGEANYRYRMLGLDSSWTYSSLTTVEYPSLPPGEYEFQVMARNNDGYWSSKAASYAFVILPAWWQTWWFKILVVLLLSFFIALLFRWRLKVLKERQQRRLAQEAVLLSSELKALRAQMNPHFMFNVINSVQYFVTNNDPVSSQKYLSKFARLMRYVVDHAGSTDMTLQQEADALQLYLDLEALRFGEFFQYQIQIHLDADDRYIRVPSMVIQPYVENAIWHGIMHKKNGVGKVMVDIRKVENGVVVVIEDNGPGRAFTAKLKEKKGGHQSVGSQNTADRLAMINQMKNQSNTVETLDLYDQDGNPSGTRVILFFDIQ